MEEEFGEDLRLEWRSFLLRPRPSARRDIAKFRSYTQSWLRPASEEDAPEFRPWQGDQGPPSHSVPAHQVAKAAARLGEASFRRIHDRLLRAYFQESLDISDSATLRSLWREVGLADHAFDAREDPALLECILDEHNEALGMGANGVPAVRRADQALPIVGAQPYETYRRWVARALEAGGSTETPVSP